MSQIEVPTTLDELDVDGAIAARQAEVNEVIAAQGGHTRADFLKKFAVGAGATAVAASLVGPGAAMGATKASAEGDLVILNYALTLEYLEAAFYQEATRRGALNSVNANFSKVVGAHEQGHVVAIFGTIKKLGGKPVARPKFDFGNSTSSNSVFRQTALALEETGVTAYHGQVPFVFNKDVLSAAAGIAAVESRHATWMRCILGYDPAPKAVEAKRTMAGVLKIVKSTGFIVS